MKAKAEHSRIRRLASLLPVAGMLAATFLIMSPVAEAHGKKGKGRDHRHHKRHHRVEKHVRYHNPEMTFRNHRHHKPGMHYRQYRPRHFAPPRVIRRAMRHNYDPYYWGRVWDPRYRGYVAVYRFPVYTDTGMVYRAYGYRDGHIVARGHFTLRGPVFSVHLDF